MFKKDRFLCLQGVIKGNSVFFRFQSSEYDIMLIKSLRSIGNTLKIEYEHDIFKQIPLFLLTFQDILQMPRISIILYLGD